MTALISAELLRLRTVRSPRYAALGLLALTGLLAAAPLIDPRSARLAPGQLTDQLTMLTVPVLLVLAAGAAHYVAAEFKRGTAAMTYLAVPNRARATAAQVLTWAGLCFVLAGAAATLIIGLELTAAAENHVKSGFSTLDVAQLIGGAAFSGAVLGGVGVLAAIITRNPTIAVTALVGLNVVEGTLITPHVRGIGPYLPFKLLEPAMGLTHAVPSFVAIGLLLAYLAAFGVAAHEWALARDLT
jgi:hypothetical protein